MKNKAVNAAENIKESIQNAAEKVAETDKKMTNMGKGIKEGYSKNHSRHFRGTKEILKTRFV